MISREEAERIAEKWVNDSAPAGVTLTPLVDEFDLGYVVSARQPPGGPPIFGCGIIDKDTGELSIWPGLPTEFVISRYRERRASEPPRMWTWDPAEQARWDLRHVQTPATVTNLTLSDQVIRARSVKGDSEPHHHRLVVDFVHNLLAREHRVRGYDRCSEAVAISDALHAEDARRTVAGEPPITLEEARDGLFAGARIVTFRVREPADPVAGMSAPPCWSCAMLARHFGFLMVPPTSQEERNDG